jgi:hypothetical protein
VLHARIAETLESQFVEIAENQPELLARHYTEAGLIEKAAHLWGNAGRRSLTRSALVEGIDQITRALAQIDSLPATAALRREQINLQVALIAPFYHVKGAAAPETKAAADRARLSDWRVSRRPAATFLCTLRLLGRKPRSVQWSHCPRACDAVPGACREAPVRSAAHGRAPPHGCFLDASRRFRESARAL